MIIHHSIKWGLTLGLATSLATQILTWMGLGLSQWFNIVSIALVVIFTFFCLRQLKARLESRLTFKHALITVVLLILIARVIFQIYMFVYTRYIDPAWVDSVSLSWSASLEASGMEADRIEQAIEQFRKSFETVPMFTTALIQYAIPQFIVSLLVSLYFVIRKK
jgi:hypothetical protein